MTPQKKTIQNPGAQVDIHQPTSTAPTSGVQGTPTQDIDLFLRQGMQTVQEVNRSLQRVQDEIAYLVNARLAMAPQAALGQQQVPFQALGQQVPTPWSAGAGIPVNAVNPAQAAYTAPLSPAFANPWPGAQPPNPYQGAPQNFLHPYTAQAVQSIQPVPSAFGLGAPSASGISGGGNAGVENIGQPFGRNSAWQQTQQAFGQSRPFGSEFQPTSVRPFRLARDLRDAAPLRREPSMDLVDEGEVFLVRLEIPGVTKEDLDVTAFDDCVAVSAISGAGIEGDDGTLLRNERGPIEYRRVIDLPSNIQTESCEANLKDGILTLRLGKQTPSAAPRHLDVMYG